VIRREFITLLGGVNSRVQSGSSADEPVDWEEQSAALVTAC
jgi:hypothetical protein